LPQRVDPSDVRLYRAYGVALGVLLTGYLFFDRGFAHFHLPKVKVAFVGELVLLLGLVAVFVGIWWLRRAIAGDVLIGVLMAFMGWGAIHAVLDLRTYGYQAVIRDSALWYYGLFLVIFVAAGTAAPDLPQKLLRGFRRIVPWLTLWLPTGLLLQRSGVNGPKTRLSGVPLFSHRPGDFCCTAALCLAFLLLVPQGPQTDASKVERSNGADPNKRLIVRGYRPGVLVGLVGLNLITIVLGATQTRGGGLAALVATVLVFAFMDGRRRSRVLMTLLAGALALSTFGVVTGASYHTAKRTVSVSQLLQNVQSVFGSGGSSASGAPGAQLQGSVSFRTTLWENVLHTETSTGHTVTGLGFGPNLAQIGGLTQRSVNSAAAEQLRSAHNSLLDVLARMGLIGALLFAMFWFGWFRRMWRARRFAPDQDTRGVIGMCISTSTAILLNSFFDPTLEGAQVAAVLYTLAAIGILCARRSINDVRVPERGLRRPAPVLGPLLPPAARGSVTGAGS